MYAMVCTRSDISYAVGVVSRFVTNPGEAHWNAVKWILRYLKGTFRSCLCFGSGEPVLQGYTDADYAWDADSRKSTFGYMMTYAEGEVSWKSRLQKCVSLSTIDAEYIATVDACKEVLWMQNFLQELDMKQEKYTLYCDSQSAIHLAKSPSFHARTKHIEFDRW
jgi:ATP-binding cassette subfamily B (MDR/TAP) protein 1